MIETETIASTVSPLGASINFTTLFISVGI